MSRTYARALTLVNWKGVFYERYLLDRHVTALEGDNGAGKTTVMIAAYVALLPDMTRLRFTNLGETGATGGDKGIWGRLGEPGRPSYVALDFVLPGSQRLVVGVHLERKGEPSVEPTPFIVSGLDQTVRLQDMLLVAQGDTEAVPELPELRENAARLGGRLRSFTSVREYFATLFDQGVMPLRLGTDEERNKFNEMLRTSMTGGISRVLTSELRSFLLREERGLADTLQRMRANLDACRRTRLEVQESRTLQQEIRNVFEAGHAMFVAAYLATRERVDELSRREADAQAARDQACQTRSVAQEAFNTLLFELATLEKRKGKLSEALKSAQAWHTTLRDALAALQTLEERAAQCAQAEAEVREADGYRCKAERVRTRCRDERLRARDDFSRAARGLADLQHGIQELHRRAGAFRQARRRLDEATACLQMSELRPSQFADYLTSARSQLEETDQQRRDARARLADATAHRERYEQLMTSLQRMVAGDVDDSRAHQMATEALRHYRQQETHADRLPEMTRELAEARQLQARQQQVRAQADEWGVVVGDMPAAEVLGAELENAEAQQLTHETAQRAAQEACAAAQRQHDELSSHSQSLLARKPLWRELAARAARLSEHVDCVVSDQASLGAARSRLAAQHEAACRTEADIQEAHEQLLDEARELLAIGGPFSSALLELKDRLGADLLAGSFEDVSVEDAACLEARFGALTQALLVDDPAAAVLAVADRPDDLGDVLLVSRDIDIDSLAKPSVDVKSGDQDVVILEGDILRVSRLPEQPRLGRRAREQRAAQLQEQAAECAHQLDVARAARRLSESLLADGDALLAGLETWLAGDPDPALQDAKKAIEQLDGTIKNLNGTAHEHAMAVQALQPRIRALRTLLAGAMLLDPPDYDERARTLAEAVAQAHVAKDWVRHVRGDAIRIECGLADLRQLPLSDDEMEDLRQHTRTLDRERVRLDTGIEALEYLCDNTEALGWHEAPGRLETEQALIPALKDQYKEAEDLQRVTEEKTACAEAGYDAANSRFLAAEGQYAGIRREYDAAINHFSTFGVPEPTAQALAVATAELERLEQERTVTDTERDALLTARGSHDAALRAAEVALERAERNLVHERREVEPAKRRWEDLHDRATEHGLTADFLTTVPEDFADIRGYPNFINKSRMCHELLLERLRHARDGARLHAELRVPRDTSDAAFGQAMLNVWLTVRDWLHRRLPAQVAEVNDPREALTRLHEQLTDLEERLARQESELRGASEDVARGIDVQIRKARGQVMRLNKNLDAVSFGSIKGIQVQTRLDDHMEQVLRALREGSAQELLFQTNMPIEEALDEIFRRYGRGRTSGQRLLDYREYLHLQVEIFRHAGSRWEVANPTRLSTGEAIGVGAALMMVVLTEWERDATLLRGKRAQGSMRFLFLDEANRLSSDNLGVLFDLCQTLDLQLLIAAPEVARAEGNTTYRLVRHVTPDGYEEVCVSGRRTRGAD